jgi:hypothetical protein
LSTTGSPDRRYRVVLGAKRLVADVEVQTSVVQFADGAVDDMGLIEAPLVHVQACWESGLTLKQARELAGAIIEATSDLVRWTR